MVDFSLTDADKKIAALAREEAEIARGYSRHYDKHEDEIEPKVFDEVKDRPDPLERTRTRWSPRRAAGSSSSIW